MTATETLRAAAESLRAESTPRSDAVAEWLATTARSAEICIATCRPNGENVAELITVQYHHPLNVARTVLEETT